MMFQGLGLYLIMNLGKGRGSIMNETTQTKIDRKRIIIAVGIICAVLVVGLIGALAYSYSLKANSSQDQATNVNWTEGSFAFSLKPTNNTVYVIPTGGFRTVTITIDTYNYVGYLAFQVFIGFITDNTTLNGQLYGVVSRWFPHPDPIPINPPPWYSDNFTAPPSDFTQTYVVTFSQIEVMIWNNSTGNIGGNLYYYLTA